MKNYFDLTGKVALVTGASSGLGVQFAKALANQNATVVITARRKEKLEQVAKEIKAMGGDCIAIACDVTDSASVKNMVEAIEKKYKHIDILVNNAGTASGVSTIDSTDEEWKRVIDLNLSSVFYVGREVGRLMVRQNYGKIINIGSVHSSVALTAAFSPMPSYCATKGAVKMLTQEWAVEWAKNNITVNAIGPAYFPSEMTDGFIDGPFKGIIQAFCPMGRAGRDGELDGALIYFASDASSYTTGQILTIDGGWTSL